MTAITRLVRPDCRSTLVQACPYRQARRHRSAATAAYATAGSRCTKSAPLQRTGMACLTDKLKLSRVCSCHSGVRTACISDFDLRMGCTRSASEREASAEEHSRRIEATSANDVDEQAIRSACRKKSPLSLRIGIRLRCIFGPRMRRNKPCNRPPAGRLINAAYHQLAATIG